MCIALPARVLVVEAGHAWVATREGRRRVSTALVGEPAIGDWLLVFLDSARSVIDAARAAEIDALLDLVQQAAHADAGAAASPPPAFTVPAFTLPSSLNAAALAALTGHPMAHGAAFPTPTGAPT